MLEKELKLVSQSNNYKFEIVKSLLGDDFNKFKAHLHSKLKTNTLYTSCQLKRIFISVMAEYTTWKHLQKINPKVLYYKLLGIRLFKDTSTNNKWKLTQRQPMDTSLITNEPRIEYNQQELDKALILDLYLNIIHDWINKEGRASTMEYMRAIEKISAIIKLDDSNDSAADLINKIQQQLNKSKLENKDAETH